MTYARSPIQGAELWVPRDDRLVLQAGAYGPNTEFARVSGRSRFRPGEGLPGSVWASQKALVWRDLSTHFVRAEHARTAGIDMAVGFPWFRGRELAGVVTLLLAGNASAPACVEIWNHDEGVDVLRHGGGLYVNAPELERLSALIQFPYAAGLPGLAWSTGMPVLIDDVRQSNEFVRSGVAARAGLKRGIAIPIFRERKVVHVLTLLGSELEPFPRTFELFVQGDVGLVSRARVEQGVVATRSEPPPGRPSARHLLAQEARSSLMPSITPAPLDEPGENDPAVQPSILITLPIHDGARLRGIACLEF